MKMHFPTVPVETVRRARHDATDMPRPLVLVVDDEPIITETLALILNGSGLAVLTAPDAAEALEIARLTPPELLITDLSMPGMNGLDLAVEMVRMAPDCRVILFSGHATAGEMYAEMISRGYDFAWLTKPVHPADMVERVFKILGKRGVQAGQPRPPQNPRPYDFLSSAGKGNGLYPSAWNLTMRQQLAKQGDDNP
jgi:DNA-binding NtrC family response regulator